MSDERYSKNKKQYLTLDFDNLTQAGLKDLTAAFKRSGAKVADVVASNRPKRKDGISQKKAQLFFENGQIVTVMVSDLGDITQVKLNSIILPSTGYSSVADLASNVTKAMKANQAKFDKALARKAAAAIRDVSSVKPASRTTKARIKEAEQALAAGSGNVDAEKDRLATATIEYEKEQGQLESLKSKLESIKSEEDTLITEIESKGGSV